MDRRRWSLLADLSRRAVRCRERREGLVSLWLLWLRQCHFYSKKSAALVSSCGSHFSFLDTQMLLIFSSIIFSWSKDVSFCNCCYWFTIRLIVVLVIRTGIMAAVTSCTINQHTTSRVTENDCSANERGLDDCCVPSILAMIDLSPLISLSRSISLLRSINLSRRSISLLLCT